MNKKEQKTIQKIAKILPVQMYEFTGKAKVKGSDLVLTGTTTVKGEDVDPEKEYMMDLPHRHDVNHYLRMKKAFKKRGTTAIINYCQPFIKPEAFPKFKELVIQGFNQ